MVPISLKHLSSKNDGYKTHEVKVANGQIFHVLAMTEEEVLNSKDVLYLHVHRESGRCYVGQAIKKCKYRWNGGAGYRKTHQPKLRSAIDKYGFNAFDSYILAFCEDQKQLDDAETFCIAAAGGHRSDYVFNLAPGGRVTVDRSEEIEGFNLATGEWKTFKNSVDASEQLGISRGGLVRRTVNGELKSTKGWWFRLAGSDAQPPSKWGVGSGVQQTRAVFAVRLEDMSEITFSSISEAARQIGADSRNVGRAVNGKGGGTCNGYWLKFLDSDAQMPALVGRAGSVYKNGKPVVAINIETGERRTFLSGRAAAAELGVSEKIMPSLLKGKRKSSKGWRFEYGYKDAS